MGEARRGAAGRSEIRSYEDLIAWQRAYELILSVYACTRIFPDEERFGLCQQMRRAAVSIASNIAEGYGRGSRADYARFLEMARGSAYELQTHARIARDLGYVDADTMPQLVAEVERLLNGLIRSVRKPMPTK